VSLKTYLKWCHSRENGNPFLSLSSDTFKSNMATRFHGYDKSGVFRETQFVIAVKGGFYEIDFG
ncbi:MAG: hypothetical protein FWH43_08580, partial [Endomicrobia bacterium]|nr:hypothetical protein [Endomicrobiia bacterium]